MRWLVGLTFLGCIGCATGPSKEDYDRLVRRLEQLEKTSNTNNAKQTLLYEDLISKYGQIERKTNDMDATVKILDTSVKRMEERPTGPTNPDNGGTSKPVDPPKEENPAVVTSDVLLGLKSGKLSVEQAVGTLRAIAKDAIPLFVEQIRQPLLDREYRNLLEAVLSNLPREALEGPVQALLAEPGMIRMSAVRIVRNMGDREISHVLEPYVESPDEDFRLLVGEALVACRNSAGILPLVQSLRSPEYSNRVIALDVLRNLNGDRDLGYRPSQKLTENAEAIQKWEDWAKTQGPKLFDPK